jgi:hypothetical protein
MATAGQLQPGWAGRCRLPLGKTGSEAGVDNASGTLLINLRAKVGRLILSWHQPRLTDRRCRDEWSRDERRHTTTTDVETSGAGTDNASDETGDETGVDAELGSVTKIVIPVELVRHFNGSYRFYFRCPGRDPDNASADNASMEAERASSRRDDIPGDGGAPNEGDPNDARRGDQTACGRRVLKLHFVRQSESGRYHFLCRHCGGLVYAAAYESIGRRLLRRANKLWQHLDSATLDSATLDSAEGAAEVAQLIAGALQAETKVAEFRTAQVQRLIAWLDNRPGNRNRGPEFTL